jgi:ElaB/YqjD/DUF883 family membrane-anchored ribosome-binding protein
MADTAQRSKDEALSERFEELQREVSALTETIGRIAGNDRGANGHDLGNKAERLARKGRKAMRLAMTKSKAAISGVESTVSANPLASVAVAFGVGVLLGRLIRR